MRTQQQNGIIIFLGENFYLNLDGKPILSTRKKCEK